MTYLIVFICGILTSLPLIFDFLVFLPWISLIPLFLIAEKKKSAYRHGFVFSLGYYGVVYYWFTYLYPLDFAGFSNTASVLLIIVVWLGLSVIQGVGTAFVPFFYRKLLIDGKTVMAPFTAASVWCVMEWFQTQFWFGVPWAKLAVTQYKVLPIIQSASLFGSLFVGFLIVLVNGFLAEAVKKFGETKKIHIYAFIALGIVIANFTFGIIRLSVKTDSERTIKAACIQGNIASGDKWADDSLKTSMKIYSELTSEAVKNTGANLVVWPETVIVSSLNRSKNLQNEISELAVKNKAYIAVGAMYSVTGENGKDTSYNSIYLFHPDGTINDSIYCKRRLVPFGEYLPMPGFFKAVIPFLAEMNMYDDDIQPGTGPSVFKTDIGNIGALVCFDSIYETLTLSSVRAGAELMILSTNDSWYLDSAAVYQHNGHAVLRAVESGKCIVRAANTGISSIISEKGKIKNHLDPLVTGYTYGEVNLNRNHTLYYYVGNLIVWISFAYIASIAVYKTVKSVKRHKVS